MAATSLNAYATWAAAVFPSIVDFLIQEGFLSLEIKKFGIYLKKQLVISVKKKISIIKTKRRNNLKI